MAYYGSWKIDDYLTFCCNTHDPDTGVATDADAVPPYRVYEDETGGAILNGVMAKLDDANTVGFYSDRIQLTAASGFEKGKCYTIYISATVDGDEGTMHHNFQIEAEVDANTASALAGVADAVWDEIIEANANVNSQTARQILRIIVAALAGADAEVGDWSALSIDDSKTRISGTLSAAGARLSITTLDGS